MEFNLKDYQQNASDRVSPRIYSEVNTDLELRFRNLSVWTREKKPWYRRKPTKPKIEILRNVSGVIEKGEFVALLGPSGAGKTTFLSSIAGKCKLPSSGTVELNGVDVKELPTGLVDIIPQFEVFEECLTVAEHLQFMTGLKRGSSKNANNKRRLQELISSLMLTSLVDSTIKSLSGGERRLLSLATSLISDPAVIICDEPTTGLDSFNASLVIKVLKELAERGITMICSIHQPSSDLFNEFNFLMLMAEGKLVFHGQSIECRRFFEKMNFICPLAFNPAEFYIKMISIDPKTDTSNVDKIVENYKRWNELDNYIGHRQLRPPQSMYKIVRRNWFVQVCYLLWRSSLTLKNNFFGSFLKNLLPVAVCSMIISVSFNNIESDSQRSVQNVQGYFFEMTSEIGYSLTFNAIYAFSSDLALFKREAGTYSCTAFYFSRYISLFPRCFILAIGLLSLSLIFVPLPNYDQTGFQFFVVFVASGFASTAYGLSIGALLVSSGLVDDLMTVFDMPLYILAGGYIRLRALPSYFTCFRYLSHFFYCMDALSNIYWRKITYLPCDTTSSGPCVNNGISVLYANMYSENFMLVDSLGLVSLICGWSLLGYLGLKRVEREGYAF